MTAAERMNANSSDKLTTETSIKEPQNTEPKLSKLTERELDMVTAVFKSFETGLREGTMFPKVGIIIYWPINTTIYPGPASCHENPGPEPAGAGDS